MTPSTPRQRQVAGTELIAFGLIKVFLPHVVSLRPWTGNLADADSDRALDAVRARLDTDDRERHTVFAALARQGIAALAHAIGDETPQGIRAWLDKRVEALSGHTEHLSEVAAALVVLAVVPEMEAGAGAVQDVPAGVADAACTDGVDPGEVLVSLALFAAGMFISAFGTVQQATAALDAQAARLLPSWN